jgi:hypothetical protein
MLYRAPARKQVVDSAAVAIAGQTNTILATTNGWIIPLTRIAHCETLRIFARNGSVSTDGKAPSENPLELGLLLGLATFAFAHQKGCTKAEILAINDDGVVF